MSDDKIKQTIYSKVCPVCYAQVFFLEYNATKWLKFIPKFIRNRIIKTVIDCYTINVS